MKDFLSYRVRAVLRNPLQWSIMRAVPKREGSHSSSLGLRQGNFKGFKFQSLLLGGSPFPAITVLLMEKPRRSDGSGQWAEPHPAGQEEEVPLVASGSKCLCVESTSQNPHKTQQRQHRCQAYNFSVGRSRKYVGIEKEEKKKQQNQIILCERQLLC